MKITCNDCNTNYKIDDSKIKGDSIKTRCPKCKFVQTNIINPPKFNGNLPPLNTLNTNTQLNSNEVKDPFSVPFDSLSGPGEFMTVSKKRVKKVPQFDLNQIEKDKKKKSFDVTDSTSLNALHNKDIYSSHIEEKKDLIKNKNQNIRIEKKNSSFLKKLIKFLFTILIIVSISIGIFLGVKKITKDTIINNQDENNPTMILKKYREQWNKNIIQSKINVNKVYLQAIEHLYKNSEVAYPRAVAEFQEVYLRMPENINAFYYTIISESLSTTNTLSKDKLLEYKTALDKLEKFKKEDYLLYIARSSINLKLGNQIESSNDAEEALKLNPSSGLAYFFNGLFYVKTEKPMKAVDLFKKAIENNEKLEIAKTELSKTFIEQNLYQEGFEYYKNRKTDIDKYTKAELILRMGFHEKALEILKKVNTTKSNILFAIIKYQFYGKNKLAKKLLLNIEKNIFKISLEEKISVYEHLLNIFRLEDNKTKVIEYAEKLNNIRPNRLSYNFNLALIHIQKGNYKEAKIFINKTKEFTKEYVTLLTELSLAKKDYKNATKHISKLIDLFPYEISYRLTKILIAALNNDIELINNVITDLHVIEPDFSIRNRLRLDLFVIQKDYSYIKKYLLKKLSETEDKEVLYKNLAITDFYFQKYNSSLNYFKKSNEIVNRNHTNYLYMAYIYFIDHKYSKAIEIAKKGIEINKFDTFLYLVSIKSALKQKNIDIAKQYLKDVKTNTENENYILLMEALILDAEGKAKEAKIKLNKIKTFFSNDYLIKRLLFKLQ